MIRREFGTVLVVDPSKVGRALVARLLRLHCNLAIEVGSVVEARERLPSANPSLVVMDVAIDGGFDFLEHVSSLRDKPAVLVLAIHPNAEDETRASLLGAIGYLAKPISLRSVLRALRRSKGPYEPTLPRAQTQPLARVVVIDPESKVAQVTWDVSDMNCAGALLSSHTFLPVGTRLQLLVLLDNEEIPVHAEVVRVQEPTWGLAPGLGVTFHYPSEHERSRVERFISDKLTRR